MNTTTSPIDPPCSLPYPRRMAASVFGRGEHARKTANEGLPYQYQSSRDGSAIVHRTYGVVVLHVTPAPLPNACEGNGAARCRDFYRWRPGGLITDPQPEVGLRRVTEVMNAARRHINPELSVRIVHGGLRPYVSDFTFELRHEAGGYGTFTVSRVNGERDPFVSEHYNLPIKVLRHVETAIELAIADLDVASKEGGSD